MIRLRETEHFIGVLKDRVWIVVEGYWTLMMYREKTVKKGCEKEWRKLTLKGKDEECDIDDKGLSTLLTAGFLMTHLP